MKKIEVLKGLQGMNVRRIVIALIMAAEVVVLGMLFTVLIYIREEQLHRITHYTLFYPQTIEICVASLFVLFLYSYYILPLLEGYGNNSHSEEYEDSLNKTEKDENCFVGTGGQN